MTVLTFPSSPTEGQVYNAPTGVRYVYDGVKWIVETTTSTSEAVSNSTQDRVAPMFVDGDHDGISFTYNAATNVLSATVTSVNGNTLVNGIHDFTLTAQGTVELNGAALDISDLSDTSNLLNNPIPSSLEQGVYNVSLDTNGNLQYPGGITQSRQDDTFCSAGVDTVVYTSTAQFRHAIKLFVMVEGMAPGGDGVNWDTQACDVIAVRGYANDIVHVTTYGVTYSSAAAFATFDGQWNAITNRIEITCRPVSPTNGVVVSVHAIEMNSND